MKPLTGPVQLIDKDAELIETVIIGSIKMEKLIFNIFERKLLHINLKI